MSLSSLVNDLATRIGQEVKAVRAELASGLSAKAADDAVVKLAGDQSVAGVKTFISGVSLPEPSVAASAVRNDDTRLSNARTPTTHASSHGTGGSDPVSPASIGAVSASAAAVTADQAANVASIRTLGTGALQAAAGNDSRFTNSRTPTGTAGGSLAGTYPNPTIAAGAITGTEIAAAAKDPVAATAGLRTLGTGAQQAAAGNDSRLSDERDSPAAKANAANGWAKLDGSALLPQAIIPAIALTDYLGSVASQAAMLALTGQRGDWCYRTDTGTDWQLVAEPSTTLASWQERHYPASPVSSVNGRVGAVTGLAEASALAGYQPIDQDLTDIAALAPANGDFMRRVSGAWSNITTAALKAALSLVVGDVSGAAPTASPSFTGTATFGGRTIQSMIALTDAATIAVDAALGNNFAVTLGGNRTMGAPSNATVDGQEIKFRIRQDATGSRTITWTGGTGGYEFAGDIAAAPTLTTGANRVDYVAFKWDATTSHWHCIGYNRGHL